MLLSRRWCPFCCGRGSSIEAGAVVIVGVGVRGAIVSSVDLGDSGGGCIGGGGVSGGGSGCFCGVGSFDVSSVICGVGDGGGGIVVSCDVCSDIGCSLW